MAGAREKSCGRKAQSVETYLRKQRFKEGGGKKRRIVLTKNILPDGEGREIHASEKKKKI